MIITILSIIAVKTILLFSYLIESKKYGWENLIVQNYMKGFKIPRVNKIEFNPTRSNISNKTNFTSNGAINEVTNSKTSLNVDPNQMMLKNAQTKLQSNLKNLEFMLTLENSLMNLASKDQCSTDRLEEFMKMKKELQINIINLSQLITGYQSGTTIVN